MAKLNLKRPLVIFDLETTGVDIEKDRVVQLACLKIHPDNNIEKKSVVVNPDMPIPVAASDVHGITDEIVKGKPVFKKFAKGICRFFEGCDIGGYNSDSFDIPLLRKEFARVGIDWPSKDVVTVDVMKIERAIYRMDLSSVYERYFNEEFVDAHDASADTDATSDILLRQLSVHDLAGSVEELQDFGSRGRKRVDWAGKLYEEDGVVKYAFGKNIDCPVLEELDYAKWMIKGNFPEDTKECLRKLLTK